jgi:hypothetical protein
MPESSADLPAVDDINANTRGLVPPPGNSSPTPETAKQYSEAFREKLTEGTAEYLAQVLGDRAFLAATKGWQTESFPETEAADAIDGVSGQVEGIGIPYYRELRKAVVLPGDDALLRELPTILRRSKPLEVDVSTAKTMSGLRDGQNFVIRPSGLGLGTPNTKSGSRTTNQHPGCRKGDCQPAGVRCRCNCSVCRPYTTI